MGYPQMTMVQPFSFVPQPFIPRPQVAQPTVPQQQAAKDEQGKGKLKTNESDSGHSNVHNSTEEYQSSVDILLSLRKDETPTEETDAEEVEDDDEGVVEEATEEEDDAKEEVEDDEEEEAEEVEDDEEEEAEEVEDDEEAIQPKRKLYCHAVTLSNCENDDNWRSFSKKLKKVIEETWKLMTSNAIGPLPDFKSPLPRDLVKYYSNVLRETIRRDHIRENDVTGKTHYTIYGAWLVRLEKIINLVGDGDGSVEGFYNLMISDKNLNPSPDQKNFRVTSLEVEKSQSKKRKRTSPQNPKKVLLVSMSSTCSTCGARRSKKPCFLTSDTFEKKDSDESYSSNFGQETCWECKRCGCINS
jgi:hypothetical protein